MASTTDSARGKVFFFEDFLYDVVADKPEYSVDTDPAVQILATGQNGIVRATLDGAQSNIGGMGFGQLQWYIPNAGGEGHLLIEVRLRMSAISSTDGNTFFGFTDVQEDTLTENPFTISGTAVTAATDPNDALGMVFHGAATNASWYPVSENNDSLVIDGVTNMTASQRTPPVATEWQTLRMVISDAAKTVEFSVDGNLIYLFEGSQAIDDVALTPVWVNLEGTDASNVDLDYIYVESTRLGN